MGPVGPVWILGPVLRHRSALEERAQTAAQQKDVGNAAFKEQNWEAARDLLGSQ